MKIEFLESEKFPKAVGPYSQVVKYGNLLFLSGQISIDPQTQQFNSYGEDIAQQTQRILQNIATMLATQNLTLNNIIKTTIFLRSMADFPAMNRVYERMFNQHRPARSTVAVSVLPKDAAIEIEAIVAAQN